jgi:hypothetical protein
VGNKWLEDVSPMAKTSTSNYPISAIFEFGSHNNKIEPSSDYVLFATNSDGTKQELATLYNVSATSINRNKIEVNFKNVCYY